MTLEKLALRYIRKTDRVLTDIRVVQDLAEVGREEVDGVVGAARRYLEDAKYFQEKERFETSLASVAYCEGLLDALRLLELVEFSWPERR